MMKPRTFLRVAVATVALSWSLQAQAQEAASEGEDTASGEIIVTAQKRSENLQDVPMSVAAISGENLSKAGVTDVTGLTNIMPSLVVQPATGSMTALYIRGVGTLVGNSLSESPVAFNFNQIYVARPSGLLGTFYDLERVEVLKGPQGTLYGRNATGGAVNVIPKRPQLGQFGGEVHLDYGNYNAIRAEAAVNIPLGENAAFRLAGKVADRDGYLSDGYDDENGQALRGSLRWEQGVVSTIIVADYFKQGGKGNGSVLVPSSFAPTAPAVDLRIGAADPRSTSAFFAAVLANPFLPPPLKIDDPVLPGLVRPKQDGYVDGEFWGVSANIDADLDFATLSVVPGFRRSKPNYLNYNGGFYARAFETADQTSLEVRLTSNGDGPFKYVIGGYYFNEEQDAFNHFVQGQVLSTKFELGLHNKSAALFGQATYEIAPGFRLLGGLRYSREHKLADIALTQTGIFAGQPVDPFNNTVVPVVIKGDRVFKRTTWKAGIEWDITEDNLLYANVATGFKSGGFFVAALDNTFNPENITAYTVGLKNTFFDNRLKFNIEGFYWDYTNQQISYIGSMRNLDASGNPITGSGLVITNAGKSRIYGAEAELVFNLTRNDVFTANVQYLDAKYTDFTYTEVGETAPRTSCATSVNPAVAAPAGQTAFLVNCSGRSQINTPKWSANLGYEHTFELGGDLELTFGGRTKIESSRFLAINYLPEQRQGSYMTSDLFLKLGNPNNGWSVTGYVNNVEDETIYAGTSLRPVYSAVFNVLRPPRTYGIRLDAKF